MTEKEVRELLRVVKSGGWGSVDGINDFELINDAKKAGLITGTCADCKYCKKMSLLGNGEFGICENTNGLNNYVKQSQYCSEWEAESD